MAQVPGGAGQSEHEEIVEFGSGRAPGSRWLSRILRACLVVAAATALAVRAGTGSPPRAAHAQPPPPPMMVSLTGRHLLGVTAGWDLFARSGTELIRIQLAAGMIKQTFVPALESGNPQVSLVVGAHEAVIRSSDDVPGYVVPDHGEARVLTGPLSGGGPFVPGPGQQSAWVTSGPPTRPSLSLVTLAGRALGPTIRFLAAGAPIPATAVSDGRGDVMLTGGNLGTYDAGPGWDTPVAGTVAAVGPAVWLVVTCPHYQHCRNEAIRPSTGARRLLPGPAVPGYLYSTWPPVGVTSPDGTTAAIPEAGRTGQVTLHLISLRSGADRGLSVPLRGTPLAQSMVWSPDSRWLFVATSAGQIVAVNGRTGQVRTLPLGISLPPVEQLAIRPAPASTARRTPSPS